MIICCIQQ